LEEALIELRALSHGLYPAALAGEGLVIALEVAAARLHRPAEVRATGVRRYPIEVETEVYLCCVEALPNAVRPAGAAASRGLAGVGDELRFEVRDDGAGFDLDAGTGLGLRAMHDRMAALGGALEVVSEPGRGTRVRGVVPVSTLAEAAR